MSDQSRIPFVSDQKPPPRRGRKTLMIRVLDWLNNRWVFVFAALSYAFLGTVAGVVRDLSAISSSAIDWHWLPLPPRQSDIGIQTIQDSGSSSAARHRVSQDRIAIVSPGSESRVDIVVAVSVSATLQGIYYPLVTAPDGQEYIAPALRKEEGPHYVGQVTVGDVNTKPEDLFALRILYVSTPIPHFRSGLLAKLPSNARISDATILRRK